MMTTREYHSVAALRQALPMTVTIAIDFVQFDSRNPDMSMRAPLDKLRIESSAYAGSPVWKVTGEVNKDHWWQVTLNAEDGAELGALIAEARVLGLA